MRIIPFICSSVLSYLKKYQYLFVHTTSLKEMKGSLNLHYRDSSSLFGNFKVTSTEHLSIYACLKYVDNNVGVNF